MNQPTRIIQISDTHLFETSDGLVYGVNSDESLTAVITHIRNNVTDFDAIVVTGDLTQDESLASYERLISHLAPLGAPFYWLSGNHDVAETMTKACPSAVAKRVEINQWQLLLLNSQSPGEIPGKLAEQELDWLSHQLMANRQKNTIIALHHHPYLIGSEWMDKINLRNTAQFQAIISTCDNVKAVIHGHIHQHSDVLIGKIPCFSAPSTCAQFKPKSSDFQIDTDKTAGYRVLELFDDGQIETYVARIGAVSDSIG